MALQKSFSFTGIKSISGNDFFIKYGEEIVTTDELYVRVTGISGTKHTITAVVDFIDQNSDEVFTRKQYQFALDLEGSNPIKQSYEYLKTLPEFANATDC
jgi:hypothetical protein